MYLSPTEERALAGEEGEAMQMAYRVLVAIGRLSGAKKLTTIKWAHISGVSYLTIGDYGLEFLRRVSSSKGTRFKVFATVNPCGMDVENWDDMKISSDYAEKQLKINACYEKLGIATSFTCVPYQSYKVPAPGTRVAWAESSAAIYANSILGLRTNRESAVSALSAALTGKTVLSGLHLDENRHPEKNVRVNLEQRKGKKKFGGSLDFGILGYFAATKVEGVIGFQGVSSKIEIDESKALSASIGTTGSSGMFVLGSREKVETIDFTEKEYENTFDDLSTARGGGGDLIVFGCPQMTIEELYELSSALAGRHLKKRCVVFCSSKVYELARLRGYTKVIESAGATFVRDACADFTPLISSLGVDSVETDSCKGAHYMRRVHGVEVALKDTRALVEDNLA